MMRSRWLALAAVGALGCSREATPGPEIREPSAPTQTAHDPPPPAPPLPPSAPPAASPPSPPSPPAPPPFVIMEVAPTQGDLLPVLRAQVERARSKSLRPVVEFYADWCPPCRAFQESLSDPRMIDALRGTYVIKANMDDWHDKLPGTGYVVRSIPAFFLVAADGRASGKMLDGDKWGKPTPATMSASLGKFLAP